MHRVGFHKVKASSMKEVHELEESVACANGCEYESVDCDEKLGEINRWNGCVIVVF